MADDTQLSAVSDTYASLAISPLALTRPRAWTPFTPERQEAFLTALAYGWSSTGAARIAGVSVDTIYVHRDKNPEFAKLLEQCTNEGTDTLIDLMRQKALDPRTGFLANMALLKARDERFQDRSRLEVSGTIKMDAHIIVEALGDLRSIRQEIIECARTPQIALDGSDTIRDTAIEADTDTCYDAEQ